MYYLLIFRILNLNSFIQIKFIKMEIGELIYVLLTKKLLNYVKLSLRFWSLYCYLNHLYSGRYGDFLEMDNSNLYQGCFLQRT